MSHKDGDHSDGSGEKSHMPKHPLPPNGENSLVMESHKRSQNQQSSNHDKKNVR